jgi:hypothetical protein
MLHFLLVVGPDIHPREVRLEGHCRRFDSCRLVDLLLVSDLIEEVVVLGDGYRRFISNQNLFSLLAIRMKHLCRPRDCIITIVDD